jgi:hypothetical protein
MSRLVKVATVAPDARMHEKAAAVFNVLRKRVQ